MRSSSRIFDRSYITICTVRICGEAFVIWEINLLSVTIHFFKIRLFTFSLQYKENDNSYIACIDEKV